MESAINEAIRLALTPIDDIIANGNARYFWFYVLTSFALTYILYRRSGNETSIWKALFVRDVWLSRSAINDYLFLVINPFVFAIFFAWIGTHAAFIVEHVADLIRSLGVTGTQTGTNTVLATLGLTVSLFVVNDFFRFFMHYLMHKIPFLWEFHKVHHSAEVLNFATVDRFHPVDNMFAAFGIMTGTAVVNGVFIGFFGDDLTVITFAGANIYWAVFSMIGGVLRHSPIWLSFGPRIERWIISPAMHHIHHSENPRHFDKNFGGSLSIWDRIAGTLYIPDGPEVTSVGIGEETREYRTMSALLFLPFVKAWGQLVRRNPDSREEVAKNG